MYEGIKVHNGGKLTDLNTLTKTQNGELILNNLDQLMIYVEAGASYNKNVQIQENNSDVKISFTDANGDEIFIILKGLNEILLSNNTEVPVFEVFEGTEKLASMTSIDDLEATASGGETLSTDQSGNPEGSETLEGTTSSNSGSRVDGFSSESDIIIIDANKNEQEIVNIPAVIETQTPSIVFDESNWNQSSDLGLEIVYGKDGVITSESNDDFGGDFGANDGIDLHDDDTYGDDSLLGVISYDGDRHRIDNSNALDFLEFRFDYSVKSIDIELAKLDEGNTVRWVATDADGNEYEGVLTSTSDDYIQSFTINPSVNFVTLRIEPFAKENVEEDTTDFYIKSLSVNAIDIAKIDENSETITGTASNTDIDNTENVFLEVTDKSSTYGTYTVTASGSWTYTLDNTNTSVDSLDDEDVLTDTITITSEDGTTKDITVYIDGQDDFIKGTSSNDTLEGTLGSDKIKGYRGSDIINGNDGADVLKGNGGKDILDGGAGADKIYGGNGKDTITFDSDDTVVNGGKHHDTLKFDNFDEINIGDILQGTLDANDEKTKIKNIEEFDLTTGTHVLSNISADDILSMTSTGSLKITIDDDTIDLNNSEWINTGKTDSDGYTSYESTIDVGLPTEETVELLINKDDVI